MSWVVVIILVMPEVGEEVLLGEFAYGGTEVELAG